jgi:RNA polymerase sigma-70 factor (ECF subfamily)
MSLQQTDAQFRTTNWPLIDALREPGRNDAALDALISRYWPPVYAVLRHMGRGRDEAAEITQAFFTEVVIGRRLFARADAERGKLRCLLLAALKRYVIDQHRRHVARPDRATISPEALAREELFLAREPELDTEQLFERRWAVAVLDEALSRCERYFEENGLTRHWAVFDARVITPALGACAPPALARLAADFDFPSEVHVASALKVVRKRLRLLLKEVASETADEPADQEAEFGRVVNLLGS